MNASAPGSSFRRVHGFLVALLLSVLGLAGWWNSLSTPFVYDDEPAIVANPRIRELWPFGSAGYDVQSTESGRPFVRFTLAVNYALGELDVGSGPAGRVARALGIGTGGTSVRGYHLFNLAVHVLSALVLFGVVRRTLRSPHPSLARFHDDASVLALAVAALWLVHPLQTDAVTYVIQRTELLMGLFLLLTLYAAIRARESARRRSWALASVVFCALGMASKEAMASAPILVALHDRGFAFSSWREALRQRWRLYAGLAATWLILGALVAQGPRDRTVGFALGVPWWRYGLTQLGMILHYLRMVFWPDDLVLDHGRELVDSAGESVPGALVVGGLALATAWALVRRPAWGFPGAWFFLILAPSSSIVPIINEVGAERRMHLPLAAVVAVVVLVLHAAAQAVLRRGAGRLVAGSCAVLVVLLCAGTVRRNRDFASDLTIWLDAVEKRPENPAARNNLGRAYAQRGRFEEALEQFWTAIRLPQCGVDAFNNYGQALSDLGRHAEAVAYFQTLQRENPHNCRGYEGHGIALLGLRRWEEAAAQFRMALTCGHRSAGLHSNLGWALYRAGHVKEALAELERALAIDPADAIAARNLAEVRQSLAAPGAGKQ